MCNELERLYKRLKQTDPKDLHGIEPDFFACFYRDKQKSSLPAVKAFLIVSSWYGTSERSGVWEFYESTPGSDIEEAANYLKEIGHEELSDVISKGIHDWANEKYRTGFNYPDEWMNECDEIDNWIAGNRESLTRWLYDYLIFIEKLFL